MDKIINLNEFKGYIEGKYLRLKNYADKSTASQNYINFENQDIAKLNDIYNNLEYQIKNHTHNQVFLNCVHGMLLRDPQIKKVGLGIDFHGQFGNFESLIIVSTQPYGY